MSTGRRSRSLQYHKNKQKVSENMKIIVKHDNRIPKSSIAYRKTINCLFLFHWLKNNYSAEKALISEIKQRKRRRKVLKIAQNGSWSQRMQEKVKNTDWQIARHMVSCRQSMKRRRERRNGIDWTERRKRHSTDGKPSELNSWHFAKQAGRKRRLEARTA